MQIRFVPTLLDNLVLREIDADDAGSGEAAILATVYNDLHPWADFNADGDLLSRYVYGEAVDQIMARVDAEGDIDWYNSDNLGSVRQIVDADGSILNETHYDSFGNVLSESAPGTETVSSSPAANGKAPSTSTSTAPAGTTPPTAASSAKTRIGLGRAISISTDMSRIDPCSTWIQAADGALELVDAS